MILLFLQSIEGVFANIIVRLHGEENLTGILSRRQDLCLHTVGKDSCPFGRKFENFVSMDETNRNIMIAATASLLIAAAFKSTEEKKKRQRRKRRSDHLFR